MTSIFNLDWETIPVTDSKSSFYLCRNSKYGNFYATDTILSRLDHADPQLLSILYENHLKGRKVLLVDCPEEVTSHLETDKFTVVTQGQLMQAFPRDHKEKQLRILLNMYRLNSQLGAQITDYDFDPIKHFVYDDTSAGYLLNLMARNRLIELIVNFDGYRQPHYSLPLIIDEAGWELIDEVTRSENSKNAFIAMWFDAGMNDAYQAIEEAVSDSGFIPLRVDRTEHNNEISGEIMFDIKHSRFLIAEVTGQRQGVYYEAGYAIGQGIPVIWCCRADDLMNVHFDTRQYNHVVWNNEAELKEKMVRRIKGTILLDEQQ